MARAFGTVLGRHTIGGFDPAIGTPGMVKGTSKSMGPRRPARPGGLSLLRERHLATAEKHGSRCWGQIWLLRAGRVTPLASESRARPVLQRIRQGKGGETSARERRGRYRHRALSLSYQTLPGTFPCGQEFFRRVRGDTPAPQGGPCHWPHPHCCMGHAKADGPGNPQKSPHLHCRRVGPFAPHRVGSAPGA